MNSKTQIERFLNRQIARNEQTILDSIDKLENRIVELLAIIETNRDGNIVAPSRSLAQRRSVMKQIIKAYNEIYQPAVELTLSSYSGVSTFVASGAGVSFQTVSKNTLLSLIERDRSFHQSLTNSTQARLSDVLLDHVVNGRSKNDLIKAVRSVLNKGGEVDGLGRSMSTHARVIANDGLSEYFATASDRILPRSDDDVFEYFGSLIKDSRPWCVDHVGKQFTRKQIREFDDDSWKGKKSGSTLIVRGGYNCKHKFIRIV